MGGGRILGSQQRVREEHIVVIVRSITWPSSNEITMCHSSNYHWKWNGTTTSNNNNSQPQNVCINWGISEVEGLNDGYGLPYTQHPPPTHPCSPTQTRIWQDLMWLAVRIPGPARYHALGNIIFRDTTQDYIVYDLRGPVVGLADSCVFVDC